MAVGTLIRLIGWGEFHFAVLRMACVGSWYRGEKIKFSNKKELVALGFVADGTVAFFHPRHIVCIFVFSWVVLTTWIYILARSYVPALEKQVKNKVREQS